MFFCEFCVLRCKVFYKMVRVLEVKYGKVGFLLKGDCKGRKGFSYVFKIIFEDKILVGRVGKLFGRGGVVKLIGGDKKKDRKDRFCWELVGVL